MNVKGIAVIIALILIAIPVNTFSYEAKRTFDELNGGKTLYVGGNGPNNYTSIQAAINAAEDGDTIFVYNRTYYENVIVNKSIKLIGEDRNTTIIDGEGNGSVVKIVAKNVTTEGLSVRHVGKYKGGPIGGILIYRSSDNEICNCNFLS